MDKPDDPLLVNNVGGPALAIEFFQTAVIRDQRKSYSIFFAEFLVRCQRVGTDAHDLGVELFKFRDIGLKSLELAFSDRGEIGVIERQDHRTLFEQLAQSDFADR